MKTLTTMAALAALPWLLQAAPAGAQVATTIEEALEELRRERETGSPYIYDRFARDILRQVSGPRTSAELDALADRLAAMMADATLPEHVRDNAESALLGAARPAEPLRPGGPILKGTPYPRAFDLLVQVYEGGTRQLGGHHYLLGTIWRADPERGPAYVRDVFERSEPPALCSDIHPFHAHYLDPEDPPVCAADWPHAQQRTSWCWAGRYLFGKIWDEVTSAEAAEFRNVPYQGDLVRMVPVGLPEHVEDWHRRCGWMRPWTAR